MSAISSDELLLQIRKSQPLTRLVILGVLAYFLSFPLLQHGIAQKDARIVLGWFGFAVLLEIGLSVSAWLLARQGEQTGLRWLAWAGALVIASGIWSDVLSTVFNSPDMARESNPIIVFLRENGFSLWLQYLAGFIAQSLLTVIACALWVAFVRHLSRYKAILLAMRPQSLTEFLWASLGGRTYFSKTENLKVSRSYRLIWWLVLPLILPFDRFLLALEWIGILPPTPWLRGLITTLQTLFFIVSLLSWLLFVYFENRASLRADPVFASRAQQAHLKGWLLGCSGFTLAVCALACFSGVAYLWATREPEYLQVRIEYANEPVKANAPFPVVYLIENIGSKEVPVSEIQATVWETNGSVVSEKLLFVLATPADEVNTYGPQTTLKLNNVTLSPGNTLRAELWFAGLEPGEVLLKTSIYSGWREKMAPPVNIQIAP